MKRTILISCLAVTPFVVSATGMAVSLQNLYLQNAASSDTTATVKNIGESGITYKLPAQSMCKISQPVMFFPFEEEKNQFVIMVETPNSKNPIVIDKFGLLSLASNAVLPFNYSGNVKYYNFAGYCGNKFNQAKSISVKPHDNESSAPDFRLANCKAGSSFVYTINTQYVKVKHKPKALNFADIANCNELKVESASHE